jgi:hypothetical protein
VGLAKEGKNGRTAEGDEGGELSSQKGSSEAREHKELLKAPAAKAKFTVEQEGEELKEKARRVVVAVDETQVSHKAVDW